MDFSNYMILSDLDGTLFDSECNVSQTNRDAIRDFVEHGGRFGISTGRTQNNAAMFLKGVDINTPSILYNGSALYDFEKGSFLRVKELPKPEAMRLLDFCRIHYPAVNIQVYTEDEICFVSEEKLAIPAFVEDHLPCRFTDRDSVADRPWLKLLMCSNESAELKSLLGELQELGLAESMRAVFSADIYLEFLPAGVSKGAMLDEVKAVADFVTVSNEEHVVAAIVERIKFT